MESFQHPSILFTYFKFSLASPDFPEARPTLLRGETEFCRTRSQGKKSLTPDHRRCWAGELHEVKSISPSPKQRLNS